MSCFHDLESQTSLNNTSKESDASNRPIQTLTFANPKPLGIFSFALTTTILSLINIQAGHVTTPNIVVGVGTPLVVRAN